jgi:predicted nucleic acid-binding protein
LILYLDTSALVKLYVRERGTGEVQRFVRKSEAVATSLVAYAEIRAAFARALRSGLTTPKAHGERVLRFNQQWDQLLRVELTPLVIRHAGDVAELYGLRGFGSIHLASALWLQTKVGGNLAFAAYDERLATAAKAAGLDDLS